MKKIVLLGLMGLSLISCVKENKVVMKYAYITRDNMEYGMKHYKVITTQLCSFDKPLSHSEIIAEQDRLKSKNELTSDMVIVADTLVEIDDNVTNALFAKVGM
jgi:acyl-ACP thioesterase